MPPLCSIVFMPRGVRRRRTEWPSTSDRTEATCRFAMNRRLVLLLAWLTLLPYWTALPDRAQRRGMALPLKNNQPRREGGKAGFLRVPPPYVKQTSSRLREPIHDPLGDILDLILGNHPSPGRNPGLVDGVG